eukprot:9452231-Alexandrium_andersonii.AAC.1
MILAAMRGASCSISLALLCDTKLRARCPWRGHAGTQTEAAPATPLPETDRGEQARWSFLPPARALSSSA